ncbi:hypothetical protein H6G54_00760 [Anabaena cylindrica FACHB-243]|uniref:Uncharacterized protein n=1 Tax=Anabaena cylindrica (strain ATCC 27899 / PCC 7122) TaxID=272123 RepID=K9ZKU3_ANACC|nr:MULTISPECIES: hypothetical protein [Anabaena]AFZ59389.1 hypothetical protein Anacy_4019 [Anabaena cylindrica PCC 7122]MBD2416267.1 hypothetical protein [Anabaena cylindrica FACHB-243]MBY5280230.1 hypothetical protein [Anabaena sp. CCAP 1446/1C]MBY5308502.1 hypothetical protein [Anabaena sp. CCAP 1446/1C]MCM2405307.1 hypothetical protein [Anabaena sp. CCAP 1446/1C]
MKVRLHDGYGGYHDHELQAVIYYPSAIFWNGFLYLHHGDGQYYSHPYYLIPPSQISIEDVR